jgi:hypothetical protein
VNFGKKEEARRKKEEARRKKEERRGDGCQLNVKCSTRLLFDDDCPDPLIVGGNSHLAPFSLNRLSGLFHKE